MTSSFTSGSSETSSDAESWIVLDQELEDAKMSEDSSNNKPSEKMMTDSAASTSTLTENRPCEFLKNRIFIPAFPFIMAAAAAFSCPLFWPSIRLIMLIFIVSIAATTLSLILFNPSLFNNALISRRRSSGWTGWRWWADSSPSEFHAAGFPRPGPVPPDSASAGAQNLLQLWQDRLEPHRIPATHDDDVRR